MKTKILLFSLIFLLILPISYAALECELESATCSSDKIEILALSSDTNAHTALPNQDPTYLTKLCCSDISGTDCSAQNFENFLKLSSTKNAHVEISTLTNYNEKACISAATSVTCVYTQDNQPCPSETTCLVSISDNTNAHLGNCDSYPVKVCCALDTVIPSSCGDSVINPETEGCDDGDTDNNDDCLNDCTSASCGDGYLWKDHELCDTSVFSDLFTDFDCSDIDHPDCSSGSIACSQDCEVDISDCCNLPEGECGDQDNEINQGEWCDGPNLLLEYCYQIDPSYQGDISCNDDCTMDISSCMEIETDCPTTCIEDDTCNDDCGLHINDGCSLDPDCSSSGCVITNPEIDDLDNDDVHNDCDICQNTPQGSIVNPNTGCTVLGLTCTLSMDCTKAPWGPCENGYRTRDTSLCETPEGCEGVDFTPASQIPCIPEEEEFPVYTSINLILTLILLTGFYLTKSFKNQI